MEQYNYQYKMKQESEMNFRIKNIKKFGSIALLFAVGLSILLLQSVLIFVHGNAVADLCVKYDTHTNIITVSCKANLSEIDQAINNRNVLEKDPLGVWVLKAIIEVNPGAKLTINQTDTSWLKITNKNNTEPNFISVSGGLKIDGIKITSWDPSFKNVIRQNVNGSIPRPYIRIHNASGASVSANISNSEVAFLGYASMVGTNGLLYYHGGNESSISNNTFHDMWDGFYSDSVSSVTIKNNKYYNNLRYGIDPHSGSHDLNVIGNLVYGNNAIGIICSDHCYNILFSNNVVHDNGVAGLMFSVGTNNSIAKNNYAYHEKVGISIYQSSNDKVYNNLVKSSNKGLYAAGSSSGNQIYNNTLMNGSIGTYLDLDNNSKNNLFKNNHINNISQPISQDNPQKVIAIANSKNQLPNPFVSINITNPKIQNQTILTNFATVNGTTSDSGNSGIKKVEVLVNKIPSNNVTDSYKLAIPLAQGNWSRWSFPVVLQQTGLHLVQARVTDNAGNQATSNMTIHYPTYYYNKRIAFVEPTFTYAAYKSGGFYDFYKKYSLSETTNKTITTDLNLLKNRPIPHGPFPYYTHPDYLDIPYIGYYNIVLNHVNNKDPFVTHLTDVDVHEGKIFQPDGRNAYDVLFLFHNEYETQAEYNNLRQFVSNGGTIVFTEGNTLTVEVNYNKTNDSITFVKGHYWNFDGKVARKGVPERWLKENREWMGSNFFDVPSNVDVKFRNNPFNYTHNEEQYVTNPQAKIMINYEAYNIPKKAYQNATVAAYQMDYLDGKVIDLGIWGHVVENNKAFLKYFDNVILPLALRPPVNSTEYLDKFYSDIYKYNTFYISVPTTGFSSLLPSTSGVVVYYPIPPAIKNFGSKYIPVCSPSPGSIFPIGDTKVKCIAKDKTDNKTIIAMFTVEVTASCVNYDMYTNTINIACKASLSKINQLVNDHNVLEKDPHGIWILNATLHVSPRGELTLNRTDTSWLRITNHGNVPNSILISGKARIEGVKITSWDPISNDVIRQNAKGSSPRPYILINSGSMNISNSEIAFLGFASNRLNYGISFNSGIEGSTLNNNTFHDNFGIAIYGSSNDKIYNNLLKSSYVAVYIAGGSANNHIYKNNIANNTFGVYFADNTSKNNLTEDNYLNEVSNPIIINGINNVGRNNTSYGK